jgi:single-stranded-DNA-specific exonuclease
MAHPHLQTSATPVLSCLGARWLWPEVETQRRGAALAQATGLPRTVAEILVARGYEAPESLTQFLTPRLEQLPEPSTLKSLTEAVARLSHAIIQNERIARFGDYDVDGTCATAMLTRYLRALGVESLCYIPDRLTEGYGPNPAAMETLAQQGVKVLVTVDTGTNAPEAMAAAQALGLEVIVTDHHPPSGVLPPAVAVLNPHRADDTSTLQGLCGSGVVFYLLLGLNRHLRTMGFFNASRPEPKLTTLLDLVALATVADVMPLTGVNRILVAKGLQQLATWQHRGLAALASVAGVKDDISTHSLGFALGPRLNAAGRIESAHSALKLLLAEDAELAYPHAQQLNQLNLARQEMEKTILREALAQAEEILSAEPETPVLVLHGAQWHPGVVGIVASRVKERCLRPTFVLGVDSNGHLKGSGRSVPTIDLGAAVAASAQATLSGGGHAAAAGVSLKRENLAAFIRLLAQHITGQLAAQGLAGVPLSQAMAPTVKIEASASIGALTAELAQNLLQIAPFGAGNPEPILALPQTVVTFAKPVGATAEHLKLRLQSASGGSQVEAIAFGAAPTPLGAALTQGGGKPLTLAATLKTRQFNGKTLTEIHVKDAMV